MKKTLLISLFFPPQRGGISNSLWNTCINLPQDKIVVLTKPSKVKPKADFKIYRRKILSNSKFIWPRWICLFWYTKKIIKKEEIEIIQAGQILPIGTVALIFKKLFKI
ncbi:hypothetical protein KKF61_05305, partial [Patescibacteria group bacterium]|nr:hypothetical protein [Patescibacteria group bacterium]